MPDRPKLRARPLPLALGLLAALLAGCPDSGAGTGTGDQGADIALDGGDTDLGADLDADMDPDPDPDQGADAADLTDDEGTDLDATAIDLDLAISDIPFLVDVVEDATADPLADRDTDLTDVADALDFDLTDVADAPDFDADVADAPDLLDADAAEVSDSGDLLDADATDAFDVADSEVTDAFDVADVEVTDVSDVEVTDVSDLDPDGVDGDLDDAGGGCVFPPPVDDPAWDGLEDLRDDDLVLALHDIVADSVGLSYDAARDIMYVTDQIDVDDGGLIEGIYTGWTAEADGTRSPDGPNGEITTEHTWPRSDGADTFPAEGDLHHLMPAIAEANNSRSNYDYGEVACGDPAEPSCPWSAGGSRRGPSEVDGTTVFEARHAFRGDVARAHFYFSVRYELPIGAAEEAVLRLWNCEDPPDDVERARNDAIELRQENRNPFVDHPEWVEHVADY